MSDSGRDPEKTGDDINVDEDVSRTETRPLTLSRKRPLFRPPEFLKRLTGEETTKEGDSAKFTCKIVGFPKPILSWYKDDDELSPDGTRVKIIEDKDGSCCIDITSLLRSDEAAYRCRAENSEGSASSCWYMAVKSKGDKKSRRRSRSCSPRRGVSYPPLFPTILEKVDEEEKEEEETKEQPVSPLTELYDGVKDKRKEWFKFVGEWAFAEDEEENQEAEEESDDTEEEKIKREEENNEKNLSSKVQNAADAQERLSPRDDQAETESAASVKRKMAKDKRNGSPEDKDAKNRISRSEKRAAGQGHQAVNSNVKLVDDDRHSAKNQPTENSLGNRAIDGQGAIPYMDESKVSPVKDLQSLPVQLTRDLPEDGPSIFRPKSTDRPIQAPCIVSRSPSQNRKQGAPVATPNMSSNNASNDSLTSSGTRDMECSLRENYNINSEANIGNPVSNACSLPKENVSEESTSTTIVKDDIKRTSKSKFSPNQKSKLAAKRKRRRSIKSLRGHGFLPSPEEIFLYLTALTFFCIFFNISPVPFILLVLWGEISTCIFYSLYYGTDDDSNS